MSRQAGAAAPSRGARLAAAVALVLLLAAVAAAQALETAAAPTTPVPQSPVTRLAQEPATEGTWYCPIAAEGATVAVAAVGDASSQVTVDGEAARRVEPGAVAEVDVDDGAPVAVQWSGGPAVATWRVAGDTAAAAPCEARVADRWLLPGLDTADGAASTLHLFNPFEQDAVARVTFGTAAGPVALVATESQLVEAGRSVALDLTELQPEVADLAVEVHVQSGRLVAQGETVVRAPGVDGAVTGRAVLPAAPAPSTRWSFAGVAQGEGRSSWLSVFNPTDREAAVAVRVSDPRGRALPAEVSVAPGGVARIGLDGTSASRVFGVELTSVNDVPVVAAQVSRSAEDAEAPWVSTALGAPRPARRWALAGVTAGTLAVYNPGPHPARVDVAADDAPAAWSGIDVPPNAVATVSLADAGQDGAVRVLADRAVAVLARSDVDGARPRRHALEGVAVGTWTGPDRRPAVRRDPTLSRLPSTAVPQPEETAAPAPPG